MKFFMSAVCALSLAAAICGCATGDEDFIIQKGITDERVDQKSSSDFGMKNLEVLSKTDDNGLLTVDVTIEISRTSFWYWVFNGDPLLTLAYRFDWIDEQGRAACLPWQFSSALPGNILRFHGIAPAEKYTAFKLFVQFYKKGEKLPVPDMNAYAVPTVKKDTPAKLNEVEQKLVPAEKSVVAPVGKTEMKVAVPAEKAEVKAPIKDAGPKKAEAKKAAVDVKGEMKTAEADVRKDVKAAEKAVKKDVKSVEKTVKADAVKAEADVRKAEKDLKTDVKKVDNKVKADVKKVEKELRKEEGKLTESFY